MNINRALKSKNRVAKNVTELKALLVSENSFKKQDADKQEYNLKETVQQIEKNILELVSIKTGIAKANADVWPKIFRIAELKGLITSLRQVPVKVGSHLECAVSYNSTSQLIEYDSQLKHKDIDELIENYEKQIEQLESELDVHNSNTEIDLK